MLAVFAVVLALAGSQANTTVACAPHLAISGFLGQTYLVEQRVVLRTDVCLGMRYAGANRAERAKIAHAYIAGHHGPLTATSPMAPLVGVSLLTALHEAEHLALNSEDECLVEKTALKKLPVLLRQFLPLQWKAAYAAAKSLDTHLSAAYHGC